MSERPPASQFSQFCFCLPSTALIPGSPSAKYITISNDRSTRSFVFFWKVFEGGTWEATHKWRASCRLVRLRKAWKSTLAELSWGSFSRVYYGFYKCMLHYSNCTACSATNEFTAVCVVHLQHICSTKTTHMVERTCLKILVAATKGWCKYCTDEMWS